MIVVMTRPNPLSVYLNQDALDLLKEFANELGVSNHRLMQHVLYRFLRYYRDDINDTRALTRESINKIRKHELDE